MALNDDSLAVACADRTLGQILHFLYQMEKKCPSENWEDEALEPIRGLMDQLCGWCAKDYQLYGKKNAS